MSNALAEHEPAVRRRTMRPLAALRDEMSDLASNFLAEMGDAWPLRLMSPSIDVSETDSAVEVRVDLPGIKPADIDVQLSDHLLRISGRREEHKEEKGRTFHRIERRCGNFSRSVTLPCAVDEAKIDAHYQDGVLTVKLPKTAEARARKIKVHS